MKKICFLYIFFAILLFPAVKLHSTEKQYFQQRADHLIHVRLDDVNHVLHAHITTRYQNNSPDTLHEIYMHLWLNAFSGDDTALAKELLEINRTKFHFADSEQRGYIDSLNFHVNGKTVVWGFDSTNPDIAIIYPEEPLLPGGTLVLSTPFRVKFPDSKFSRPGHNGQAYHATQWYPKPAVYDNRGWHPMPYLSFGEFFSDFGNVDVFLTLPSNYVVASTGEVMNWTERAWLDDLAKTTEKAAIADLPPRRSFPESDNEFKTIHLRQEKVHDFAWVADKRFYVAKSSITLPDNGPTVETWAFFYESAPQWLNVTTYLNESLLFFSSQLGNYPWPSMSAVLVGNSGGAGMEYPAFTVIGPSTTSQELERVIVHETAHNWFYGALASNERMYPWMDEAFAQYYEMKFHEAKYPRHRIMGQMADSRIARYFNIDELDYPAVYLLFYHNKARLNLDQPIELPAPEYTLANYGISVYYKGALSIDFLRNYLGNEVFEKAMKEYYNTWAFRHPYPQDLRDILEKVSGQSLGWFFEELLPTTGKIDYQAVKLVEGDNPEADPWQLTVVNKGDLAVPFPVSGMLNDSVILTAWYDGFKGKNEIGFPAGNYDALKIDAMEIMPELYRHNNQIRTNGRYPRSRPLEMKLLGALEDPEKIQLFFMPVLGWNKHNGFMPGMAFYNSFIPYRPTQWLVMPMYATANDKLTGIAWLEHSFFPDSKIIHTLKTGLNAKRFAISGGPNNWHFNRIETLLEAALQKPFARSSLERRLWFRNVWVMRDNYAIENQQAVAAKIDYYVNELGYSHRYDRVLNPWGFNLRLQQGEGFSRAMGEADILLHYPGKLKGVHMRVFAGTFIDKPSGSSIIDYRFRLGALRGTHDFLFDNTYLGRSETIGSLWGNQVWETEGGLKYPTYVGQTWDWLASVNIKADLPFLPARLYFDAGTYKGAADAFHGSQTLSWVLGVQVVAFSNLLEVNFPLTQSSDLELAAQHTTNRYIEKVTFSIYLNRLNPFRLIRNIGL